MDIISWMFQNREVIEEEVKEIRQLLAKAENIICSNPEDLEFCQRAKTLRMVVHDTPDANNVKFGVETLEKLLQQMQERKIEGFENLKKEFSHFKNRSRVLKVLETENKHSETYKSPLISHKRSFFQEPPLEFEDIVDDRLIQQANHILVELRNNWEIGPHFMPFQEDIETPFHMDLEHVFSQWYGYTYRHARNCVRELVGLDTNPFFGPTSGDINAFNTLRAACEIALRREDKWAAPLIRCTIVAAQELRRGGSTGLHGHERLRAKLIVGAMIGSLSRFDLESAIKLADLTIESISFSRSQILYEQENHPEALERLIKFNRFYHSHF